MSTIQRWNPARDFARLQDEVNRLFEGNLGITRNTESYGWTPAVDVFEDTEGVTFKFDLPEVEAKDVDVRLEDGTLTVRGERKLEREDKREGYHRIERALRHVRPELHPPRHPRRGQGQRRARRTACCGSSSPSGPRRSRRASASR